MKRDVLYYLASDLHALYCKTSIPEIEVSFTILTSAYQDAFMEWLSSKKGTAVRDQLPHKQAYDTFLYLKQLRQKLPNPVEMKDLVMLLTGKANVSSLSIMMSMGTLLDDPSVEPILSPFKDILVAASRLEGGSNIDSAYLRQDLQSIYNSFLESSEEEKQEPQSNLPRKRLTKKEKGIATLSYMLRRFSDEVATAADNVGNKELANAVRGGALLKPSVLANYAEMSSNFFMMSHVDDIVKDVMRYVDESRHDLNYNYAKDKIMGFLDVVDSQALLKMYEERQQAEDISSLMDPSEEGAQIPVGAKPMPSLNISDVQWLTPNVLAMIVGVLGGIYGKVR